MDVIYIELSAMTSKKRMGVYNGGRTVSEFGQPECMCRITRMTTGGWSIEIKDCAVTNTVVLRNTDYANLPIRLNGRHYTLTMQDMLCLPINLNLTDEFISYCRSCGLQLLTEFENEYCRLHKLSIETDTNAFAVTGAEGVEICV